LTSAYDSLMGADLYLIISHLKYCTTNSYYNSSYIVDKAFAYLIITICMFVYRYDSLNVELTML
jgi:hypothetical protein